jgi:hypothetical protein
VTPTPSGFYLLILSPNDNSVVDNLEVPVSGMTAPSAIVTVNGVLASVEEDGSFTTTIVVEEGPNLIEVIATDPNGEERSAVLAVVYFA